MKSVVIPTVALALVSASCGPAASGNGGTASNHEDVGALTATQDKATTVPQVELSAATNDSNSAAQSKQNEKQQNDYTEDTSHATISGALKQALVGVAEIDGQAIIDFRLPSRCQTIIVTQNGQTLIDWSGVGNFARNVDKSVATISIDDGHGEHSIRLPEGVGSQRVDGGFGLLADECGSK